MAPCWMRPAAVLLAFAAAAVGPAASAIAAPTTTKTLSFVSEEGRPLARVELTYWPYDAGRDAAETERTTVVSDRNGEVAIVYDASRGLRGEAFRAGRVPLLLRIKPMELPSELRAMLTRARRIAGRIDDAESDRPIAGLGAIVLEGESDLIVVSPDGADRSQSSVSRTVAVDAAGRWEYLHLPERPSSLFMTVALPTANGPTPLPRRKVAAAQRLGKEDRYRVPPLGSHPVIVVDSSGQPIAGSSVWGAIEESQRDTFSLRLRAERRTDAAGRVEMPCLPGQPLVVAAYQPERSPDFAWTSDPGFGEPLALTLREPTTLTLRVVDQVGRPVRFARVLATCERVDSASSDEPLSEADRIVRRAERRRLSDEAGRTITNRDFERLIRESGRATPKNLAAVRRIGTAEVWLDGLSGYEGDAPLWERSGPLRAAVEGTWTMRPVPAGALALSVLAPGVIERAELVIEPEELAGPVERTVAIEQPPLVTLHGRLTDATTGEPVTDGRFVRRRPPKQAKWYDQPTSESFPIADDGSFTFQSPWFVDIPDAASRNSRSEVGFEAPGYEPAFFFLMTRPGEFGGLNVKLTPQPVR